MKRYLTTILLILLAAAVSAQEKDVLIKNGTILTITNGTLSNADILIKAGIIDKIGRDLKASKNARVIDATGLYVMPGIVDAHSHIALDAINEATNPVTAEVWTGDAINPLDVAIYRALAGGVTISHALHGSANAIGGESETIKHRYGTVDPDELRMKNAPRTIKFALGENPTRVHGGNHNILPRTRMGVETIFRNAFSEAQEYMKAREKYNVLSKKKGFKGKAPEYSLRLETLADILRGDIIVHCHSYRADEIYMLMKVFKDFGIERLVFQHVNEGFKVAPELAAFGAMASVFSDWWAYKFEVYYSTAYNAAILAKNNVVTSINSDSGELIRHLYHEAAKTQKYGGLSDNEALSMITINPAKQLGIAKRVGSIEEGKDGDIAIFKNHPLSIYTIPMMTIVDGVVEFDRESDKDDMRIYANVEDPIDVILHSSQHDSHRCMQNTDFLFKD